jgi:hypothetical protein
MVTGSWVTVDFGPQIVGRTKSLTIELPTWMVVGTRWGSELLNCGGRGGGSHWAAAGWRYTPRIRAGGQSCLIAGSDLLGIDEGWPDCLPISYAPRVSSHPWGRGVELNICQLDWDRSTPRDSTTALL